MLASDVLDSVRDFLNDPEGDRYSDDYLMSLLNEGLLDMSKRLKLFKSEVNIPFIRGQAVYSLPVDFIEFHDISLNGETSIKFISKEELEARDKNWRQHETENAPTHIIYDKQTLYQFRAYPIPIGENIYELYNINQFGIAVDVEDVYSVDTYGIFPSLEDDINAILFDPVRVNDDLDNLANQVSALAAQVSQYSSAITANSTAIDQIYGIATSAEASAQGAQLAASTAVQTVNELGIEITELEDELGSLTTTVTSQGSQITSLTSAVSTAQSTANQAINDADDASTEAAAAQATANSAVTTANTAISRLNNVDGDNTSIESLASQVSTIEATASNALSTANTANNNSSSAVNTANSAINTANSVKARIDSINGGGSIEALATQVTSLSSSVTTALGNANAAVSTANAAMAAVNDLEDEVTANASSISTLNASVAGNTAQISIHATAIAGLEGATTKWEVVTDVNDLTSGFGIYNNGSYEEIVFRTDNFKVYPNEGDTGALAFTVESGQVVIPNAMIANILQSTNFVTGVSGWQIRKDTGAAEFASIIARGDIEATSLAAATGTFSGTLTAAAIDAVDTINIKDQSIVIDTSYFAETDAPFGESGNVSSNAFVTLTTKSITMDNATSNSTILIEGTFDVRVVMPDTNGDASSGTNSYDVRIVRDGTPIYTKVIRRVERVVQDGVGFSGERYYYTFSIGYIDSPGAGTFNYQIQIRVANEDNDAQSTSRIAFNRFMKLSGAKK